MPCCSSAVSPTWPAPSRAARGRARADAVTSALDRQQRGSAASPTQVIGLGKARFADSGVQLHFLHGHANVGYGVAHNLMLHGTGADYQLVLNPDVELATDALVNAIRWLDAHPGRGRGRAGGDAARRKRRFPVQALSGRARSAAARFRARRSCAARSRERLERYDLRDVIDPASDAPVRGVPVMSGCCMLVRSEGDRRDRRLRPGIFPLLRGLRLERAPEQGRRRPPTCRRFGRCITAAARRARVEARPLVRGSGFRFYGKHGWRFV